MPTPSDSNASQVVAEFYRLLDANDVDGAGRILAPEVTVRFGDRPAVEGRETVAGHLAVMGGMIDSWTHDFVQVHVVPGPDDNTTVIAESFVVYNMLHSGNEISHNSISVSVVSPSGEIIEQRMVGDLRPVLDDHQAHAPASSREPG